VLNRRDPIDVATIEDTGRMLEVATSSVTEPAHPGREWLLLLFFLPAKQAHARVQAWRRLQRIGAVSLRNSAYALFEALYQSVASTEPAGSSKSRRSSKPASRTRAARRGSKRS